MGKIIKTVLEAPTSGVQAAGTFLDVKYPNYSWIMTKILLDAGGRADVKTFVTVPLENALEGRIPMGLGWKVTVVVSLKYAKPLPKEIVDQLHAAVAGSGITAKEIGLAFSPRGFLESFEVRKKSDAEKLHLVLAQELAKL